MDSVNRADNPPNLAEALAWLDYCLGESIAAMQAVKAGLASLIIQMAAGETPMPMDFYHEICEAAAKLVTFRARCGRWLKRGETYET